MTNTHSVRFLGTDGPVVFRDASQVTELLPELFSKWQYEPEGQTNDAPCLDLSFTEGKFHISSQMLDAPKSISDPLNAACTLIAELAWARVRHEADLLCFHGAAIEFDGSLVLFPNKRRAGKSTLTACLAAEGHRVFTDDYLPLRSGEGGWMSGIANGAAPRLRLPIPDEFSPELKHWLARHEGPKNRQYLYLNLEEGQLATHGECLPVSSVVLLDRVDTPTAPCLEPVDSPEVLRRLIYQNFSRSMNPARVLAMICGLADWSNCLRLTYSNAEEAARFLTRHQAALGQKKDPPPGQPALPDDFPAVLEVAKARLQDTAYIHNPNVYLRRYGDEVFLASSDGPGLHHFDGVTTGIWNLLSEPVTQKDISEILASAFPDEPRPQLDKAVRKILRSMVKHSLILPADQSLAE